MHGAKLDDRTLRRIIAVLVALAGLAERAAGQSFPVRWFVLAVLGHAEAVARAFVVETTQATVPDLGDPAEAGNSPADALLLSLRLRMLAALLAALLRPAQSGLDGACILRAPRRSASGAYLLVATPGDATLRPDDTS